MDKIIALIKNNKRYSILAAFAFVLLVMQVCVIIGGGARREQVVASAGAASAGGEGASETVGENGEAVPVVDEEHSRIVVIPRLVNNWNLLESDFVPNGLVQVGKEIEGRSELQINSTVRAAYIVMQNDMREDGVKPPMLISGYRSYAYQKDLYDKKVAELGAGQKVTAVPGTSEHQYGASVDVSTDGTCQNDFGETKAGQWIAENSYKYGFVVRYAVEKKELTGINFEPWHIRYVGVEHATAMYNSGMCLEEYVDYLRENYPNAIDEVSPDQFPAPRWAGDTGEDDAPPSSSDVGAEADADAANANADIPAGVMSSSN